ncbi:MAG: hypothetical protein ACE5D1_04275, partial [Fidelibacterota bacterium]
GDTLEADILSYRDDGTLAEKVHFNQHNHLQWLELYGAEEIWSAKFRQWAIPGDTRLSFAGQHTRVTVDSSGRIRNLTFITVDGTSYGNITMDYTKTGRKASEIWTLLPKKETIRRYQYSFDSDGRLLSLSEFGREDQLISQVDLTVAAADELYQVPPPRLGNRLLEAESIIESIHRSRIESPFPATIPHLTDDLLQLVNGQLMIGTLTESTPDGLKIRLLTGEVLNIPLTQISWARSRNGKYLVNRGE